jgi:hypothetical protein
MADENEDNILLDNFIVNTVVDDFKTARNLYYNAVDDPEAEEIDIIDVAKLTKYVPGYGAIGVIAEGADYIRDEYFSDPASELTTEQKEPIEASDEDIEDSLMSEYLHVLTKRRKSKEKESNYYNNIILFETEKPEKLKNTVLAFEPEEIRPIFEISNLQLSNLVPVIQIYKIFKSTNDKEELEISIPFPEYTYKEDLQQIFESRTGRGSGIGIKSFKWDSMAKNQANLAQFSAELELYLQDAGELKKIRNHVTDGKRTYTASILDLLYPKSSTDTIDPFDYDPKNFSLKAKVGWQLKTNNKDKNTEIDNRLLKNLVSEFHITLYKHDIQINDDGSVTLNIKLIAMAEALLDDFGKSDVFFDEYVNREQTEQLKRFSKETRELRKKLTDTNISSDEKEKIEKEVKQKQDELDKTKLANKRQKRNIYKNFVSWLISSSKLEYFNLSKEEKNNLKSISTFKTKLLDSDEILEMQKSINSKNEKDADVQQVGKQTLEDSQTRIQKIEKNEAKDKYDLDVDKVNEALIKSAVDKYQEDGGGNIVVPFFYLGDLLEYFIGRFADARPTMEGTQLPTQNIKNKKIRIVLGQFSYSDYGNPQVSYQNGGTAYRTQSVKKSGEREEVISLTGKKEVANIAHIPISFKSFGRWFNQRIVDGNLEKYSLNRFIRDVMYNLVPANISPRLTEAVPSTKLNLTMNSEVVDDNTEYSSGKSILEFLQSTYAEKNNYIVDYDQENPFQYLKSLKSKTEQSRSINSNKRNLSSYIFLFSNYENSDQLSRNYEQDLKNNILHFYVGEEKGIVKSIKFSREDNPRLDAHNLQVANQENNGAILRSVYNATIEMFGNNIFVPGTIIFINPTYPGMKIGDPILLELGLGGYFMVLKTTNKISGGLYTTSLQTKWQSFGIDTALFSQRNLTQQDLDYFKQAGYSAKFARTK